MRLRAIEINGFKSFAEKTKLNFEQGITGIVGPNGSGKSNILDAILWALGEQSYKSLRANKGKDIIFSGGKEKKAKGMARVSLIIDNSEKKLDIEYTSVKITRKIYSSGENEYLINNQIVRLKDIKKLFLDTGIGKRSYSVIGQGQVEEIVMSNSSSLRSIIDEAAEVKKHKLEKNEIKKKLKKNQDDLDKIVYLEEELASNLKPLEKQAKKTEKHNMLKNSLDQKKELLFITEIKKLEKDLESINKKEQSLTKEDKELKDEFNRYETKIEEKLSENEKITAKKEEHEELKEKKQIKLNEINNNITLFTERIENYKKEKREKNQEIDNLKEELDKIKIKIKENKKNMFKFSGSLDNDNEKLKSQKEIIESQKKELNELESKLQDIKDSIFDNEIEKTKLKNSIEDYKSKMKMNKSGNSQLQEELTQIVNKLEKFKIKEENIKSKKDNIAEDIKSQKSDLKKLEKDIDNKENKKLKFQEDLNELDIKKSNRKMKLENLERLAKNYDGFFYGVKRVLKADIEGVVGPFLSIIDIPEEYETGIQSIVGNAMQNIVVEDSSVAKECVNYLKKNRAGRATFLPLDTVKSYKKSSVDQEGVIGIAADLVNYNEKYEKVINNVLGSILVVEDMDTGLSISKGRSYSGNIVTLEGEIIYGSGKITGGQKSKSKTSIIFDRKNKIKKLKKGLKRLTKKEEEQKKRYNTIKEDYKNRENEFLDKKDRLFKLVDKLDKYETEINDISYQIDKLEKEKRVVSFEKDEKNKQDKKSIEKLNDSEEKLVNINKRSEELNKKIKTTKQRYQDIKSEVSKREEEYSKEQITLIEKKEKYNSQKKDIKNLKNNLSNIKDKILTYKNKLNNIDSKIVEINQKLISFKKDKESLQVVIKELKSKIKDYQKRLKEIEKKEKEYIVELKDIEKKMVSKENELSKIKNNKTKCEMELSNKKEHLKELNVKDISGKKGCNDIKTTKEEIDKLENKISKLGKINSLAIEEYKEMKEKHDFFVSQREDLEESKKSLEDLIENIEDEIIEKFMNAYKEITKNFKYMCKKVLDNTKGDIKLTDKEDLLNSGLELIVKFKNKKYQSLSLLSGGEKSMIAVALILAIFKYKPSPFTFFDEIEAALDASNTKKLMGMLREFTQDSQFILITHNKETMREADKLYGVTMQKSEGVSKMISVDM